MPKSEDIIPVEYPYAWSTHSELALENFLLKYRPSMVQNDGKKLWIWVQGSAPTREDTGVQDAIDEASLILKDVTEKVEAIKNDETIPLRSNKKTGAKSKKEVREQVQAEATEKLKNVAVKHGYVSGKWLMRVRPDNVDSTWSTIAKSLVSGPLASTCAYMAKVATSPELSQDSSNYQHLIYIYIPDVYDKVNVSEVGRVLLKDHGFDLPSVKSNLYTSLGIDSNHASGISSTTWKRASLISDAEKATLLNAKTENKAPSEEQPPKTTTKKDLDEASVSKPKPKPKLRKKAADDPFASDDDKEDDSNAQTKKRPVSDRSANEDESDSGERPKKRKPTRARK